MISSTVHYDPDPDSRHENRYRLARGDEAVALMRQWCEYRGIEFGQSGEAGPGKRSIHGFYFFFRIRFPDTSANARWLPGLARLVYSPDCRRVSHRYLKIHDVRQLLEALTIWYDAVQGAAIDLPGLTSDQAPDRLRRCRRRIIR